MNIHFARLCGIDNSVNCLKFLYKILLWSWHIDLITQLFSVCFYMRKHLFLFYLQKLSLPVSLNSVLLILHIVTQ